MRILALLVFLASCSSGFTNRLDEQRFVCGEGYEEGKEYIKISGEAALVSFPKDIKVTKKGCVERPVNGEVFVTDLGRTSGVWLGPQSKAEVQLEPLKASQLPSACNSVVHGDGRGFTLNFDLSAADKGRDLQSIEVKLLSSAQGDEIASWPARSLAETLAFSFKEGQPVLSGEYRLLATISDGVSGALSKSECTLRIDYSELLISPAESVKTKRVYNGQEVLLVQPGYNVNFYVHEGFRDVSIEYCLKQVRISDVSPTMDPSLLSCETTQDFLKTKSPSLDQGFWVLNYRGQRGLVRNAWQHAVFMVDKVCIGVFDDPKALAGKDCTTIRGSLNIGDQFKKEDFQVLEAITVVYGNITLGGVYFEDLAILPNLEEVYGNLSVTSAFRRINLLPNLKNIWGNLEFNASTNEDSSTFKQLVIVSGDLLVTGFAESTFIYFPELEVVENKLQVEKLDIENINFLPKLEVANRLAFLNLSKLKDFKGLDNVKVVSYLTISDLSELNSMKGLGGISQLKEFEALNLSKIRNFSDLNITEVELVMLDTLPLFESFMDDGVLVKKNLQIGHTPMLENLKSFRFSPEMDYLTLYGDAVKSLAGVEAIKSVGWLSLEDLPLKNLDDFESLTSIGELKLRGLDDAEIHLSKLQDLEESVSLTLTHYKFIDFQSIHNKEFISLALENNSFQDLSFLSEGLKIRDLSLIGNADLQSLKGIDNLGTLAGDLVIEGNTSLQDIKPLEKLTVSGTVTSDNPNK